MNTKKILYMNWILLTLMAVGLLGISCGSKVETATTAANNQSNPPKLVKVQAVATRTMVEKLTLPGSLQAENLANILSTSEGKISQLKVREGDPVKVDQVVAMISSLLREDIINSARLQVQIKKEAVAKNPDSTRLQNELAAAERDYQFAQQQYQEIPVTSPITGVVSQRWIDLGDMIPAKTKLFEIQSSAKLILDVPVSELDIRKLKIGQIADIYADACPGKVFRGSIQRIYPQVDARTRNGMIEMRIADPCPNLKSGMFVRITFVIRTIDNAIAIPIPAVIERPQKKVCFIAEESKAKAVVIKTGLETEGWVQILEGLVPGDKVVVEGQEQLKNGSPVKIQGQK